MIKVAISYRVLQGWRVPIFERLSKISNIEIKVFYGEDFEGTKIKSFKGAIKFPAKKLKSNNLRIPTSNGVAYVPFSFSIYKELKDFSPDVIVVEGASNFINNIICFFYARRYGKKIIQWGLGEIEGRSRSLHRKFLDVVFKYVEKNSDAAIAYSSYGASYYQKIGFDPKKITVAVNVIDTESRVAEYREYCKRNSLPYPSPLPSSFNLLFVGSLSENKGVETLIEAYSKVLLSKKNISITLTIVGDGSARENLRALAKRLGVLDKVEFAGNIEEGIGRYFYNASVFVLPGLGGLAVSDALVHGVPVICGIGDGCEKDLIQSGKNGVIIKNLTVESLVEVIVSLYAQPGLLDAMRREAQSFCNSGLDINNYVSKIKGAILNCAK